MGTNRIKVADTTEEQKKVKKNKHKTDKEVVTEASKQADAVVAEAKEAKPKKKRPAKIRSLRYKTAKLLVDRAKLYTPKEAVALIIKMATSSMDETVECHLNTRSEKINASVNLPYGTGKKQRVAIADDAVLEQIAKGKIDFDILIATPQMMPKIAKVARVLGPKGLMPNPKNGTITTDPEGLKKKLEGGETRFKCEPKAALIHMVIGKASFGEEKLIANLESFLKAVKPANIAKGI